MVHPEAPLSSPWVKCRENSRGQKPKKGGDGGGKGGWKGKEGVTVRGLRLPPSASPEVTGGGYWALGQQRDFWGSPTALGPRREHNRKSPAPSHLLFASHTRPAAPAPGAASRARPWQPGSGAVEPCCYYTGFLGLRSQHPAPAPPSSAPSAAPGRGDPRPGNALEGCLGEGGPTELGPCLPSRWALGHTWTALCPGLSCQAARASVRAPKCPASWHPLAAGL